MERYIIGIDIGTQGTKAALFREDGVSIAEAFLGSHLIYLDNGGVEQDPEEIFNSVILVIRRLMENSDIDRTLVKAIGIDGQMAGIMGIDKDYNPVTPYDSWLDTRCEPYIKKMKERAGERILELTGGPVTYAHGPKILWWKGERKEVYGRIDKFIVLTAFVAGKLAGLSAKEAYIDYTHLHFTGFADNALMEWSKELLQLFEVEESKLPPIVAPWKIIGTLDERFALHLGLSKEVVLTAGCGDQAATSLGAGITQKGQAFDVAGTASVFSCCVDRYSPDKKNKTLLFARSIIEGLWIPLAYINGGGLCIRWFLDEILKGCEITYADLEKEAKAAPPGCNGLVFIPHFSGRVCPNMPDLKGAWLGLGFQQGRGVLYRSIMESIGYEYSVYLDCIRDLLGEESVRFVQTIGGGAKSRLFNQIKSNITGLRYEVLENSDCAPLGAAITAGYGAGIYQNLTETLKGIVKNRDTIEPEALQHQSYLQYRQQYIGYLDAVNDIYAVKTAEWRK